MFFYICLSCHLCCCVWLLALSPYIGGAIFFSLHLFHNQSNPKLSISCQSWQPYLPLLAKTPCQSCQNHAIVGKVLPLLSMPKLSHAKVGRYAVAIVGKNLLPLLARRCQSWQKLVAKVGNLLPLLGNSATSVQGHICARQICATLDRCVQEVTHVCKRKMTDVCNIWHKCATRWQICATKVETVVTE